MGRVFVVLSVVSVVSAVEEVEALVVVETVPGTCSFPQEERTAAMHKAHL